MVWPILYAYVPVNDVFPLLCTNALGLEGHSLQNSFNWLKRSPSRQLFLNVISETTILYVLHVQLLGIDEEK